MDFGAWVFIGFIALVMMLYWMVFEERIPVTTLPSGFLWFYWGFQATSIQHGTQTVVEYGYPTLRWFGFFMGIINILLLLMWLWTDEDEDIFASGW